MASKLIPKTSWHRCLAGDLFGSEDKLPIGRGTRRWFAHAVSLLAVAAFLPGPSLAADRGMPWPRRVIDDSSQGADGVRLADVNGDGLLDIATGWEEGGVARAYLHPDYARVRSAWPAVTVGNVRDLEDAVFVDLDGDGAVDVVSSAEGNTQGIFVHWAPRNPSDYLNPAKWQTAKFPASAGRRWMFAVPMQVDGQNGVDLVAGGKDGNAVVAWFRSPAGDRRNLAAWTLFVMSDVGWTMSLIPRDLDGDGDLDMVVTDRFDAATSASAGARWLENPGTGTVAQLGRWPDHLIGAQGLEPMLSDMADLDGDGLEDLLVPVFNAGVYFFHRLPSKQENWPVSQIALPENVGIAKAVCVGDVNLDGRPDLVVSFSGALAPRSGVVWMSYAKSPTDAVWIDHEISGPEGQKFDIVGLVDMDGDGDLDVVTTEEQADGVGLGVVWYENPARGLTDTDLDGIPDDGDGSGTVGDNPCTAGNTFSCDDNCRSIPNSNQADGDADGVGTDCDICPAAGQRGRVNSEGCPLHAMGDFNDDGDVDQEDFGRVQLCLTGPGNSQDDAACVPAKLDGDSDVDNADLAVFFACMSGPDNLADLNCMR